MFALYFDDPLQCARTSDEQRIIVLNPFYTTRQAVKTQNGNRFLSFWMRFIQSRRRLCHGLEEDITIVIAKHDKMTIN